ncbi:hypothetical protein BCR34DRAFT_566188 [Clohesyomyces aquaticus]|uniref:Uncharacterized protein n=1 Tax=Clohesyomyces aquaticus TaxID=1231657 RepID=A0A1Y1ZL08_9PLEO|nr:hypothetical protein BCR34DRAFT_566188 [Clohesyomyces aquaticus]
MSDAEVTKWTGPGMIQNSFTIPQGSKLSLETAEKWFDDVYVPELVASEVVKSAWRFKAADPNYKRQNIFLYKVPDLALVQAGKLQEINRTSDMFPTDEPIESFVESETKIFSFVQLYETSKQPEDASTTIIMAAMEPSSGGEADLDAWYREEHNQQMSEQPGWKRTTRFSLLAQQSNDGKPMERISFLAIHEFGEGHKIGNQVEALDPMTDWTKRCMANSKAIDAAVYQKVKFFGKDA